MRVSYTKSAHALAPLTRAHVGSVRVPAAAMTEEKPAKRRMSSSGSDDPTIRALLGQVAYYKRHYLSDKKEHEEVRAKNLKVITKLNKENAALKKQRFELKDKLSRTDDKLTILTLDAGHMKEELKRLRGVEERVEELEAALAVNPDANIRLRVKQLLAKYHPDKHSAAVPIDNEEVTRDLLDLLGE